MNGLLAQFMFIGTRVKPLGVVELKNGMLRFFVDYLVYLLVFCTRYGDSVLMFDVDGEVVVVIVVN